MKTTTLIQIAYTEENNGQSISINLSKIMADGTVERGVRWDQAIGIMEKAKMQILGKDFMSGATERLDACMKLHEATIDAATATLKAATEFNQRPGAGMIKKLVGRKKTK